MIIHGLSLWAINKYYPYNRLSIHYFFLLFSAYLRLQPPKSTIQYNILSLLMMFNIAIQEVILTSLDETSSKHHCFKI